MEVPGMARAMRAIDGVFARDFLVTFVSLLASLLLLLLLLLLASAAAAVRRRRRRAADWGKP